MAKAFAYLVVGLRFPLLLAWAAAAVVAMLLLPPLPSSGGLNNLIPAGSPALRSDASAARLFGYPLEAGVAIVQPGLLAVLGTLGLTVVLCEAVFGSPNLVYFVPFAAGVLSDAGAGH
ncbi:MAG TPA: hypothetical protein VMI73_21230 [Trebonia sp.]|nr:hypothetical protein [Trebonia sp.]